MSNARNLARLLPNASGQLPDANLAAIASSKLSGQIPVGNIPAGSVLQVITASTSTPSFIAAENGFSILSASITPKKSTSKIVLLSAISIGWGNGSPNVVAYFKRNIGGSLADVGQFTTGSRSGGVSFLQAAGSTEDGYNLAYNYSDNPNTTSEVTYSVRLDTYDGGVYVNRLDGYSDSNSPWNTRGMTTLTLLEVAV